MAKHVFNGNVIHNGQQFEKNNLCPPELVEKMLKIGAVKALDEPVAPSEPAPKKAK